MQNRVLSQWEIDALLSAANTDGLPKGQTMDGIGKHVKSYDFKRPDKFSKDRLRTLQVLNETFARLLATAFSGYLRTVVNVNLVSLDQSLYDDIVQQMPNPTILYVVGLDPLPGSCIFELNKDIILAMVDRLLGGHGSKLHSQHEITEIEMTLTEGIMSRVLDGMKEAWNNVVSFIPRVENTAQTPQFVRIALPSDVCILIVFEVRLGETSGTISICIPYPVLEPIVSKLSAQSLFAGPRRGTGSETIDNIKKQLNLVRIPMSVMLGEAKVTVDELTQIQVGDVICLDKGITDELDVYVGEHRKFTAKPGSLSRKIAIQISKIVEESEGNELGQ